MTLARPPLLSAALLLLAFGGAALLSADQSPAWLHKEVTAPSESEVSASLLKLDSDREATYAQKGFDEALLLRRHEMSWGPDGRLSSRTTSVRQFLTDEGVRRAGNVTVSVRTDLEDLWIEEAWIALPDGRRRGVDLDAIQLLTEGSFDVFSDAVKVVIPLDGLVPGATAVLVTRTVRRSTEWPLPWSEIFFPQVWTPVERLELEMAWAPGLSPRQIYTDAGFLECTQSRGKASCQAQRIPALAGADDIPIWLDVMPQLVVAEPHTWAMLAGAERRLVEQGMAQDRGLDRILATLISDAGTPLDKLGRIHRFVADEIRYLGLEHGEAAVAPTTVDRTLDLRYGDCKGKVALFVALARKAGLDAYPALVSTSRNDLGKLILPSWQYFNHMIACVNLEPGGSPVCLDLTDPNAKTGLLPPSLYGSVALDLRDGVNAPRTLEPQGPVWDIQISARNEFDCSGNRTESVWRTFRGAGGAWERAIRRGLTVEQRRQQELETFQLFGEDLQPQFEFAAIENPLEPMSVLARTRYEASFPREQTEYAEFDRWLHYYASRFATENVEHPAWVPGVRLRSNLEYMLCPGDTVQLVGSELDMQSEFGTLTRHYEPRGAQLTVSTELTLPSQTVRKADLDRFRRFYEGALDQTLVWFRVERGDSRGAVR